MKLNSLQMLLITASFLVFSFCVGCQSDTTESDSFQTARQNVHAGNFAEALKEFQAFDLRFPKSKFASRTTFLTAKCQLGLGDYELSKRAFDDTIARYPNSLEAKKSQYKLAEIDFLKGEIESGVEKLKAIVNGPANPYMPEAVAKLKTLEALNP